MMGTIRFVVRQIRADGGVAGVLALVVVLSAGVGAIAPPWIDATLDDALDEAITESNDDLTFRTRDERLGAEKSDQKLTEPLTWEPALEDVFGDGRWSVATDMAIIDGNPFRQLSVRVPSDAPAQMTITDGVMPADATVGESSGIRTVTMDVAISAETAEVFEVKVGDTVELPYGTVAADDGSVAPVSVMVEVTGLFQPSDPDWAGWGENHAAVRPYKVGDVTFAALLAAPDALDDLIRTQVELTSEWILRPTANGEVIDPDEIIEAIHRLEGSSGWLTSLEEALERHNQQLTSATRVNAFGAASLTALFVIVIILTVRLLAGRRTAALQLASTRGGGTSVAVRQLLLEGLLIALPSATVGVLAATSVLDQPMGTASVIAPAAIVVLVATGLPLIATQVVRHSSAERPEHSALRPSARRIVGEAGFTVAAALVLWLLAGRTAAGTGIDPVVSLAPVITAVAAGLVTFRALPFLVSAAAVWTRRLKGATPFISAVQAGRGGGASAMPAIAILLAIGLAGIGASVDLSAERGRQMTSWQSVPADVVVAGADKELTLDEARDALPGGTDIAAGYLLDPDRITGSNNSELNVAVIAVDAEIWQSITADAPEPPVAVAALNGGSPGDIPAVLVGSSQTLWVDGAVTIDDVQATVRAQVPAFPGATQSPTVLVPLSAVEDQVGDIVPSAFLLGGDVSSDQAHDVLGGAVHSRADVLVDIDAAPLLTATNDSYRMALAGSALLAAAAAVLSLLIAGKSRSYSLSVLHTLGLTHRQATGVVLAETLPPAALAATVGIGVGSGVTLVASDALDLTTLTTTLGSGSSDVVLNVAGTALTAVAVLGVVLLSIAVTVLASRHAQLGQALRAGD